MDPLPYLRFLGRDEDGEPRYDKGPSNWVRLYIERPPEGLRNAETLKAVLAIDTQIDAQSRIEQRDYLFPMSTTSSSHRSSNWRAMPVTSTIYSAAFGSTRG